LFQVRRFIQKSDAGVFQPLVIHLPGFCLTPDIGTHHGLCREEPQEAQLGNAAKAQAGVVAQSGKPTRGQ
jgi:hypothetical protein